MRALFTRALRGVADADASDAADAADAAADAADAAADDDAARADLRDDEGADAAFVAPAPRRADCSAAAVEASGDSIAVESATTRFTSARRTMDEGTPACPRP
jgi:hypothetical protein